MAQRGKWISGLSADSPATEAALKALRLRLESVWHYLPLAALHPEDDIEHVHQLRVSSRRSFAAVETFQKCLPRKHRHWMGKQLRRIRRAAGDARDDDVLILRLTKMTEQNSGSGAKRLLKQVERHRTISQGPLVAIHEKLRDKGFQTRTRKLIEKIHWRGKTAEPSLLELSREQLGRRVDRFLNIARGELAEAEQLHQLRIEGKQLRYAMELFAPAHPRTFRSQLYRKIEDIQQRLGDLNDHCSALARYRRWLADISNQAEQATLQSMIELEEQALAQCQSEFQKFWTARRIDELQERFAQFIQPACATTP